MKKTNIVLGCIVTAFILTFRLSTAQETPNIIQEEESAEVFLEEYTDEFQNTFFEALKQKGIQNYDRAINLLLECKQMQPENTALDHELAKVYFLDKKYNAAQQYGIEAIISVPDNYWFLENLVNITDKQGIPFKSLESTIPYSNEILRNNLAKLYFKKGKYNEAKEALEDLKMNQERSLLLQKINDTLAKKKASTNVTEVSKDTDLESTSDNPLEAVRQELQRLVETNDLETLEAKASEAIEQYPLQPDFYYYKGLALHKTNRSLGAVTILEEGLDYLFDNDQLSNDFYKVLSEAFKSVGNSAKANMYLSKIKPGF